MKEFYPVKESIATVFSRSYELPYYQREYTWDTAQIQDLLDDFITEFSTYYQPGDDDTKVSSYGYYYLGSIIIDSASNLVDGQQRLTSISLLLIYLYHRLKSINPAVAYELRSYAYKKRLGEATATFTVSSPDRFETMQAILNGTGFPSDASESAARLQRRYNDILTLFPASMPDDELTVFATWIATNVQLISITADNGNDAYRIFSTQNDRGKPLSKMDMLKADILSHIEENQQEERNDQWKGIISLLHNSVSEFRKGVPEEETVMGMMLNSYYATEIVSQKELKGENVSKRSSMESDFVRSRWNPYKWAISNKEKMGLKTSDDYCKFIDRFQQYAQMYVHIRSVMKENHCPKGQENLYHLPTQYISPLFITLLLSPMTLAQTTDEVLEQINLIARFLDIFVAKYCFKRWGIGTETNYDFHFQGLIKKLRGKSLIEIKYHLAQFIAERGYAISDYSEDIQNLRYPEGQKSKRYKELKWIISRITAYMQVLCGEEDLTHAYQTNEYHIEHIIPNHEELWSQYGFANIDEFPEYRNNIASLLILKGAVNKGLSDRPYSEKKESYRNVNGNQYAASLSFDDTYMHPEVKKLAKSGIPFQSFNTFNKDAIANRKIVINELCKRIWNLDDFELDDEEKDYLASECGIELDDNVVIDDDDRMFTFNEIEDEEYEEELEIIWGSHPCPSGEYRIVSKDKSVMMTVRVEEYDDDTRGFIIKNGSLVAPRKKAWVKDPVASGLYAIIRKEAEDLGIIGTDYKLKTDVIFDVPSAAESFGYGSSHDGSAFKMAYYNGGFSPLSEDFRSGGARGRNNYCEYPRYIEIEKLLTDKMGAYRDVYVKRMDTYVNVYAGKGMRLVASIEPLDNSIDVWFYIHIDSFDCYGEELKDFSSPDAPLHHTSGKTRLKIPNDVGSPIPLFEKYFLQVLGRNR